MNCRRIARISGSQLDKPYERFGAPEVPGEMAAFRKNMTNAGRARPATMRLYRQR
jgi:hypothetical protein